MLYKDHSTDGKETDTETSGNFEYFSEGILTITDV